MNFWRDTNFYDKRHAFRLGQLARPMIVCGLCLVMLAVLMIVSTVNAQPDESPAISPLLQGTAADGKAIYDEKCVGCHTIGGGKLTGPDLKDVTKRRDPAWIKAFIADPPKMLATDPIAQQMLKENNNYSMPNLGLSADEVDYLVAFLTDPGAVPAAPASPVLAGAGDPVAGQRLFTGEQAFANGGPHCMACHSVNGTGGLGGGGLGPDLTHVIQRLGEPGLTGSLKTIAFPTMLGPFKNRPLTEKEQADLVAFFKESDRWQAPVAVIAPGTLNSQALLVFSISLVMAGLFFGLLLFFWIRFQKNKELRLPARKV